MSLDRLDHRGLGLAAALTASLLLVGCGGIEPTPVPEVVEETQPKPEKAKPQDCSNPVETFAPNGTVEQLKQRPAVKTILDRGRIIAGVAADNHLLGARDPHTGELEGFDIEILRMIARALWGGDPDEHITYRVITAADRIPLLVERKVDVVARSFTVNCERWKQIAFSAIYYEAGQKLLVRRDLADGVGEEVTTVKDLKPHHRVCVTADTTSQANIASAAPRSKIVTSGRTSGCLVMFQRGQVDVITADDTELAGLATQDPYAVIPKNQPRFSSEPYGVGVNSKQVDLVRFINAVLEQAKADGTWQREYDRWLAEPLGKSPPPVPDYGR